MNEAGVQVQSWMTGHDAGNAAAWSERGVKLLPASQALWRHTTALIELYGMVGGYSCPFLYSL
jgi:hypothetical protein